MPTTPTKPMNLTEWAYVVIRKSILSGEIAIGSQVNVDDLTTKLGISRTPVREAMIRLEQNGLVKVRARVGYFVSGITQKDIHEIFEVRSIVESYAAQCCAQLLSEEEIASFASHQEIARSFFEAGKRYEFNGQDIILHEMLINKLHNDQIDRIMRSCEDLSCRQRIYALNSDENIFESLKEHETLLDALRRHNANDAAEAMRRHMFGIEQRLTKIILQEKME